VVKVDLVRGFLRGFVDKGIFGFAIARSLSSLTYLQDMPNVMLIVPDAKSPGSIGAVLVL